jgi:hypothetical protein
MVSPAAGLHTDGTILHTVDHDTLPEETFRTCILHVSSISHKGIFTLRKVLGKGDVAMNIAILIRTKADSGHHFRKWILKSHINIAALLQRDMRNSVHHVCSQPNVITRHIDTTVSMKINFLRWIEHSLLLHTAKNTVKRNRL